MMLGGEDQGPETCGARVLRPGAGVERGRREDRGILFAIAPFAIGEGIDAEVQEERELVALPGELRGARAWARRLRPSVEPIASPVSPTPVCCRNVRRFMAGWYRG